MKPGDNGYGVDDEENFATLETEESLERIPTEVGCYDNYYKGVRDSILNGEKLPVTAKEGLDVIKLIQLAIESSEKGRVISIKKRHEIRVFLFLWNRKTIEEHRNDIFYMFFPISFKKLCSKFIT